jgi:alpha-methylacyl-CoA racemase
VTDGVLSLMALHIDQHFATGAAPGPGHDILTGRYACYDCYRARDGRWLAVGAIEPAFFANLCRALDLERLIPQQTDDARQDEIRAAFRHAFAARDRDDWVRDLGPRNTCVAPVYAVTELVQDSHLEARGVFVEARHDAHGRFRQLGPVLAGADRTQTSYDVRDASVTDTDALLGALGVSADEIVRLRDTGVIA